MEQRPGELPIRLAVPAASRVLSMLLTGFFALVWMLLSGAMGAWLPCAAGGAVLAGGVGWFWYQGRCAVILEAEQMVVLTPFSRRRFPYAGKNLLLRRSWTGSARRASGFGLAGTAIQLRDGKRVEVAIPISWRGAEGFQQAMDFLESLPISKRYL